MLILDSPGRLVGYIHCRTCCRCVHVDPEMFPPAPPPDPQRTGRGESQRWGDVTE